MSSRVSRRQILRTGGTAAAAVAAGGALAIPGGGTAGAAETVAASLPDAPLIDVGHASTRWLNNVQTQDHSTTMQGFAFDAPNGRLYTSQIGGKCTITYASATKTATTTVNGDQHRDAGDMCISQLDLAGALKGSMYLLGFGHGVSIGVEPSGSGAIIWTECDASDGGYGTALARFTFVNGSVIWPTHPAVQRFYPVAGASGMTPSIDMVHGILVIRYYLNGTRWFRAYDLASARAGDFSSPLAEVPQPVFYKSDGTPVTFQGYGSYGRYLYMLDGNSNTDNIYTTSLDLNGVENNASGYIRRTHSAADGSVTPREPEGMAIYTGYSSPRLCFGITDNASDGTRRFDLYYKV